ncbi:hypothetical protein [Rhodococcus sp. Q1]|uniref:hypothetical protein n=1 Tax=Rhodococcus TaxID=1827 RepID=UPI003242E1BB
MDVAGEPGPFGQRAGFSLQGYQFVLCPEQFAVCLGELVHQSLSLRGPAHQLLIDHRHAGGGQRPEDRPDDRR